jgi:uncharacterized protein (TIGR02996 family)
MADAAFLQAIADHPDEDGPRLVYADWLDERGDADRAELIRTQCELARLPETDPRRWLLEDRARALLERHESRWLGDMPDAVQSWEFRRGFPDRLHVGPSLAQIDWPIPAGVTDLIVTFLRSLRYRVLTDFLTADHPARPTALTCVTGDLARDWESAPLLARLKRLALQNVQVDDADWIGRLRAGVWPGVTDLSVTGHRSDGELAGLTDPVWSARWTGLTWMAFHTAGPPAAIGLANCPNLRRLDYPVAPLDLAPWPHLTELSAWRQCGPTVLAQLAAGTGLSRLRRLELAVDPVTLETLHALDQVLDGLSRPALHLTVGYGSAEALGDWFAPDRCRRGLTGLHLRALSEARLLRTLAEGAPFRGLTDLTLNVPRGPAVEGLPALLAGSTLPALRRLTLNCHRFTGVLAQALAAEPRRRALRELTVTAHQATADALPILAEWPGLARLDRLQLGFSRRGGLDPGALAESAYLSPLISVNLRWPFVDADADALAALRTRLGPRLIC